jgi:hypothetical protein
MAEGVAQLFAEARSTRELRHEAIPFGANTDAEGTWQFLSTQYFFDQLDDAARERLRRVVNTYAAVHGGKIRLETTIEFVGMLPPRGL